jgi:AcrR family transcriptional regulator
MTLELDGRRQRSAESRRRIVAAFLDLIRAGRVSPTAEEVAQSAQVGLRSVFRHFDDMEQLYREICSVPEALLIEVLLRPWQHESGLDRLDELAARRAEAFEALAPFFRAMAVHRHTSPFIEARQQRFVLQQADALRAVLGGEYSFDADIWEALYLSLSPEAWMRLRFAQNLAYDDALRVLRRMVRALVRPKDAGA